MGAFYSESSGNGKTSNGSAHASPTVVRSYAPATGELLAEIPVTSNDEVSRVIARARRAQKAWSVLPVNERAWRLLRLRDAFVEHADEIVEVIARECGKPRHEALVHEVSTCLEVATFFCAHAPKLLAAERIGGHWLEHRRSFVRHVPRGVVGILAPWSFPFIAPMERVFLALLAGNGVVVKPSEVTPLVLRKAKEIYDTTGLPEDLFGVVYGFAPTGQALIDYGVDKVVFTGSSATAKRVASACGARLIPCEVHVGGNTPLIACDDADLERTARAVVYGGFANLGQTCISVERVYAHEQVYVALLARVRDLVGALRQGDPSRDYVDLGAIIFADQIEIAERHVDDALRRGGELVCGGTRGPGIGPFFEPTVLGGCDASMLAMNEPTFGPVVAFQKVSTDDEAVARANGSGPMGAAYVFTRDRRRGARLGERLVAESVVVNDVLVSYAAPEPFLGAGRVPGLGRLPATDALLAMTERRTLSTERLATGQLVWFPYTVGRFHWLQRGIRALYAPGGFWRKLRRTQGGL
jgi:succinate-semialdehyde dehydrogenase/glutarate-semialdehyde dehydrogenase